jgi:hypothetical protein
VGLSVYCLIQVSLGSNFKKTLIFAKKSGKIAVGNSSLREDSGMGVTIHYQGRVNQKIRLKEFHILSSLICKEHGWEISDMTETEQKGSLFVINPHENCEPLIFRITPEGNFSDHCKTQFAPIEVHKGIVSLFDQVRIKLSQLIIQDEGGYWETRDEEFLQDKIMDCYLAIQKTKEEDPETYGPVKTEDGRIVDLMK